MSNMAEEIAKNKTMDTKDSQIKQVEKGVYNCDQCDKTYIQQKRLETHMKEKHVSTTNQVGSRAISKVTCKKCKYVSTSNMMQIHVGLHHK